MSSHSNGWGVETFQSREAGRIRAAAKRDDKISFDPSRRAARNIAARRPPNERLSSRSPCRRQSTPRSSLAPRSPAGRVRALWREPPHPTKPPDRPDAKATDVWLKPEQAQRPPPSAPRSCVHGHQQANAIILERPRPVPAPRNCRQGIDIISKNALHSIAPKAPWSPPFAVSPSRISKIANPKAPRICENVTQ
jgi:hypothetical protein